MSKIDEIKESLNSLRAYFGVAVLLIVTIGSGIISSYRLRQFDIVFWIGVLFEFALMFFAALIIHKIKTKTKEIGDL